jgi:hypothetical protein
MSRMRAWIPVMLWASADTSSRELTRPVIVGVLHTLMPLARKQTLLRLLAIIRKGAHVVEYFLFGVLLGFAEEKDDKALQQRGEMPPAVIWLCRRSISYCC